MIFFFKNPTVELKNHVWLFCVKFLIMKHFELIQGLFFNIRYVKDVVLSLVEYLENVLLIFIIMYIVCA